MLNPLRYARHFTISKIGRATLKTSGLLFLNVAVTYRCNSRCRMCNIWKIYKEKNGRKREELSLEEYKAFFTLNRNHLKDLFHIGITGGEPFLRPDLPELVSFISKMYPKASIDISTNGLETGLVERAVEEIFKKSPNVKLRLDVSLDGIGKVHDEIRGVPGAFNRVKKTCETLKRLNARHKGMDVTVSFTIMQSNYDRIYEVYEFAKKYGFRFACRPAHQSENYYGDNTSMDDTFSQDMIYSIEEQVRRIPGDYRGFFIRHIPEYLKNKKRHFIPCYSGFYSAFIDPYGDVFPCLYLNKKIGNIKDKRFFKERWNSEEVVAVRKKVAKEQCPNCWSECETNSSVYLDGMRFIYWNIVGRYL